MRIQIAALAASILTASAACAADFPKKGEAEYDAYYVFRSQSKMDSAAGSGGLDELTGITRNVKGEGPFHDMSVRCLMQWTQIGETFASTGSCVETDRDGDDIFATFDTGTHTIIGGTGKYKGITGTAPYSPDNLHDANGGHWAAVAKHKVAWEIK